MEIHTTKLSQENCIVIPFAVRRAMNLKPGEEVAIILEHGKIVLEKVDSSAHSKVPGTPPDRPDYGDEFREEHADDGDETDSDEGAITRFR